MRLSRSLLFYFFHRERVQQGREGREREMLVSSPVSVRRAAANKRKGKFGTTGFESVAEIEAHRQCRWPFSPIR